MGYLRPHMVRLNLLGRASFRNWNPLVVRSALRRHLAAVRDRRPGGWDRVPGANGIRRLCAIRDAPDGACTKHHCRDVLDLVFNRERVVDWGKLRPLLLSSLPTALAGGFIVLDEGVYKTTTGVALLFAGAAMVLRRELAADCDQETPLWGAVSVGAVVGLVSGLTGVGGGVFLAPTLIGLGWASPKQTAALSAPFILANSVVGLVGVVFAGQLPSSHFGFYAMAALGGAILGTTIGLRWLGQAATRFVLAGILLAAGIQLVFF
jgi:uncharacterized membrane protein YfcA